MHLSFQDVRPKSQYRGGNVRLNIIALVYLFSISSLAQEVQYTSCVDQNMSKFLTVIQKQFIKTSVNPEKEKVNTYTKFYPEKYKESVNSCQLALANEQSQARAIAAQQDAANRAAAAQASVNARKGSGPNSGANNELIDASIAGLNAAANALPSKGLSARTAPAATTPASTSPVRPAETSYGGAGAIETSKTVAEANPAPASTSADPLGDLAKTSVEASDKRVAEASLTEQQQMEKERNDGEALDRQIAENAKNPGPQLTEAETNKALDEASKAASVANQQAADVVSEVPQAAKAATDVAGAATSVDAVKAPPGAITTAAQTADAKITAALSQAKALQARLETYPQTSAMFTKFMTAGQAYVSTSKPACTGTAEKAELLCLESPGVSNVKTMMNIAGPVVAAVSSASKACSSLNKLTSLAGTGLTIARGVCVASKFMCDMSCGKSVKEIIALAAEIQAVQTTFNQELARMKLNCDSIDFGVDPICMKIMADHAPVNASLQQIGVALKPETTPTPGTSVSLVAKCQGYAKEVIQLTVSILGTIKASDNAKKCEQQLATTAGGAAISAQQFCEVPANAVSPVCKCKSDPSAVGCPNALASLSTSAAAANQQGSNLKNSAGVSGFASDGSKVNLDSALPSSGAAFNSKTLPSGAGLSSNRAGLGGSGAGKSGGSSSSGGGSDTGSAGTDVAAKPAKKKWDFGSFFSSGGGGGSSGGSKSSANGNLIGGKQMDAIQRKLASDQLATEVSPASGKSNWEKVRRMYLIQENTLISGK